MVGLPVVAAAPRGDFLQLTIPLRQNQLAPDRSDQAARRKPAGAERQVESMTGLNSKRHRFGPLKASRPTRGRAAPLCPTHPQCLSLCQRMADCFVQAT